MATKRQRICVWQIALLPAGLDVHKKTVVACVRRLDEKGRLQQETRTFGTMTAQVLELGDWLTTLKVTHVANLFMPSEL